MNKRFRNRLFFLYIKQLFGMTLFGLCAIIALETVSSAAKTVIPKKNLHRLAATQRLETVSSPTKSMTMLKDWRFSQKASQLEFTLSTASKPRYFYLAQPPRIVVDLPNTKLGYVPTNQNYSGVIQRIRISQLKTDVTRIVMDLAPGTFVNPKQVQLQSVSSRNPTRWVLRPFIAGERRSLPLGNLPPRPSYLSPTTIAPKPLSNQPLSTGTHNSLQPLNSQPLSRGTSNSLQPLNNQPSSTGTSNSLQPLNNQPSSTGTSNSLQPLNNQPSSTGTSNSPQPAFNVLPPLTTLPPTTTNQQLPLVSVPPLSSKNPSQLPSSLLPPASFPSQPANPQSVPTVSTPNFPVPTVPNSPPSPPNSNVINFGQPFPHSTR